MKEKIFEVNGINYKVIEIEKGAIYELQRQKEMVCFIKYQDITIKVLKKQLIMQKIQNKSRNR